MDTNEIAKRYANQYLDGHRRTVVRWLSSHPLTRSTADAVAITASIMGLLPKDEQRGFIELTSEYAVDDRDHKNEQDQAAEAVEDMESMVETTTDRQIFAEIEE